MKNIDSNIIAMGWVSFFTDMASSMVTTLLPVFVVYVLNENVEKLGYVIAIATFISYALRIVFGFLSDYYAVVKPFVVIGYAISAVTKPLLGFAHSYTDVALLRSLERVGKAVRSASKDALISKYSKQNSQGKSFGFHKMMDVSGEMLGSVIILLLFLFTSLKDAVLIRHIFEWTLLPGLMALLILIFFVKDIPKRVKKRSFVVVKEDFRLLWLLGSYFFFLLFFMSDQYFILYAKERGMTLVEIPMLVIISTATQAFLSYFSGVLIDRFGSKLLLLIAFSFGLFSLLGLKYGWIWIAFIFFGVFNVIALNALRTYISRNAHSQAFVFGLFYGGIAIFSALGALIVGFVWQRYSFENAINLSLIGSIVVMISVALILMVNYQKKKLSS